MINPRVWKEAELDQARRTAIERFRAERQREPKAAYERAFDAYLKTFKELLDSTAELSNLQPVALRLLSDRRLLEATRYLTGPPISEDDLKTLATADSLSAQRLRNDPALVKRIIAIIRATVDQRRFPWVARQRAPTDAEKTAAILASAAISATRRVETARRMAGKKSQEKAVEDRLTRSGLVKVDRQPVRTITDAPAAGHFCLETKLGTRKADFVVRLWDNRVLALECKVSNSSLNSVKRLNNDAAVKAEAWRQDFGRAQIVPAAVLAGVYQLHNLVEAQDRGLALFWAHDLETLTTWIESTRNEL